MNTIWSFRGKTESREKSKRKNGCKRRRMPFGIFGMQINDRLAVAEL